MYLAKESIEFGYEAADWRDAVRQAGKLLLNAGAITESYIDAMITVSYTHLTLPTNREV